MKRKREKLKIRIPMPPPQKPHSTKKGKRGYQRQKAKRATRTTREETEMSGMYVEDAMMTEARRQEYKEKYQNAVRNLSLTQIALVEKEMLTPEEEREVNASGILSYAREKFLEYRPWMEHTERRLPPYF